jgi:hypothetical protein
MPKLTLRRNDAEYTIEDLTFEEVKELIGVNGHGQHAPSAPVLAVSIKRTTPAIPAVVVNPSQDFHGFLSNLSERGQIFITELRKHPEGIEANTFAGKLGYKDARQIGGLTGGGLAKIAKRFGVRLKDVYKAAITFPSGQRTVTFFPGKLLMALAFEFEQEKPAV